MTEIDIVQYIGTTNEFLPENIYLYIGDKLTGPQAHFSGGYSVLRNSEGKTCLKDTDSGTIYDAGGVCSKLAAISINLGVTSDMTSDKVVSVVKAALYVHNALRLEVTDNDTLEKLESMFRASERIVGPSTYNFAAVLTLTTEDGTRIDIELDEASDICVIGHAFWVDYGPGTEGDNARNSQKELFRLLGITAWPDAAQ
jgi:hypothetical protein